MEFLIINNVQLVKSCLAKNQLIYLVIFLSKVDIQKHIPNLPNHCTQLILLKFQKIKDSKLASSFKMFLRKKIYLGQFFGQKRQILGTCSYEKTKNQPTLMETNPTLINGLFIQLQYNTRLNTTHDFWWFNHHLKAYNLHYIASILLFTLILVRVGPPTPPSWASTNIYHIHSQSDNSFPSCT